MKRTRSLRSRSKNNKGGQLAMFYDIYLEKKASGQFNSFLTGRKINYTPASMQAFVSCFAHVLPKGSYPELKLVPENIVLLTPYEHQLFDQGTEQQRKDYAKVSGCDWKVLDQYKKYVHRVIRPKYCKKVGRF